MGFCDYGEVALNTLLAILSSLGTVGAFWVSYRLFKLQRTIEEGKKPYVRIWFRHGTTEEGNIAVLTMINFGENPLPIKRMDVDHEAGTTLRYNLLKDGEQIVDWLVQPNQVHTIAVLPTGGTVGNFKLRVQYFDASFVFLNIDTIWLGPYWLDQTSAGKQTTKLNPKSSLLKASITSVSSWLRGRAATKNFPFDDRR